VDGHDHRDAQVLDPGEGVLHVGQQVEDGGAAFGALVVHGDGAAEGLQRHARAEVPAGAADDQGACLAGLVQVHQHRIQLAPERRVHGVHGLGPVHHQVGHMAGGGQGKAGEGGSGSVHGRTL